jgi:hypothetical protein
MPNTTGRPIVQLENYQADYHAALPVGETLDSNCISPTNFNTDLSNAGFKTLTVFSETVAATSMTDYGGASGAKTLAGTIPAGSFLVAYKVTTSTAFNGDTTAVMTCGTATGDVSWFGDTNIFAITATGHGAAMTTNMLYITAPTRPVVTVVAGSDFTTVKSASGVATVSIYYMPTM